MPSTDEERTVLWEEAVKRFLALALPPTLEVDRDVLLDASRALGDQGHAQFELVRVGRLLEQAAHDEGSVARAHAAGAIADFLSAQPTDHEARLIGAWEWTPRARVLVDRFCSLVFLLERTPSKRRRAPAERDKELAGFFASWRELIEASDTDVLKELGSAWKRATLRDAVERMAKGEDPVAREIALSRKRALAAAKGGSREVRQDLLDEQRTEIQAAARAAGEEEEEG